jgi:hypothetical protein
MAQAITGDMLLLCNIGFDRDDQELDWRVVFVPTPPLRQAMKRSLRADQPSIG